MHNSVLASCFDPTQSGHAIVQIEHEEQSISNQFQQIEQGQQIFHEYREDRYYGATEPTTSQNNNTSSRIR